MRMMQRSHIQRGWGDLGQHYTVFASGRVYESRPIVFRGVHAAGANSFTVGIEHQGDFRYCRPTAEQIEASAELCAMLFRYFGWPPERERIQPHSRYTRTQCPVCLECVDRVRDATLAKLRYGPRRRGRMASSRETRLLQPGEAWRTTVYKGRAYDMVYEAWIHAVRQADDKPTAVHLREIKQDGKTAAQAWVLDRAGFAASRNVQTQGNVVVDLWIPPDQAPAYVTVEQVTV